MANEIGRAYAFFDCDVSYERLERNISKLKEEARAPNGLELKLHQGISGLNLDSTLVEQLQYPDDYRIVSAKRIGQLEPEQRPLGSLKYVFLANYPGESNETTANELGNFMNFVNGIFNNDPDLFRCGIVYEKDGEYQLLG